MTQPTAGAPGASDSTKLYRLIRYGFIVYGAAPGAISLVFILAGFLEALRPLLTVYYVLSIVAGAVIALVKIWEEVRSKRPTPF